ncbi:MAG: hypothetical protein HC770_08555, partial [Pseudanabaena sp. CRU_2_10]|nr:hypothetical protein [Pseudanabaena sp. CRU_2_10]
MAELNLIYTMYEEGYHPSLYKSSQDISCAVSLPSTPPQVFELSSILEAPQSIANYPVTDRQPPQDTAQPDISSRSP